MGFVQPSLALYSHRIAGYELDPYFAFALAELFKTHSRSRALMSAYTEQRN